MGNGNIRRALAVFLVVLLMVQSIAAAAFASPQKGFKDLPKYQKEIGQLVELGIINGYADNIFRPNLPITRLQAVMMLAREMKLDTSNRPDPHFKDIKKGHPGFDVIAAAVAEGIISGKGDGQFDPQGKLTRGEMAKILAKAYKLKTPNTYKETFKDVPASYWAHGYIKAIAANKITTGYGDGTFRPGDDLTRLQFSLFMSRYINYVKKIDTPPTNPEQSAEKEFVKKAFLLSADVEKPYYFQDATLSVKYLDQDTREYAVEWKTTGGKLTPTEDKKSAVFNAQQNTTKDYTITATIETKLSSGDVYRFDKTIVLAVEKLEDTPVTPGPPVPAPISSPALNGEWVRSESGAAIWSLNWNSIQQVLGYKVYRSEDNQNFTLIQTVNGVDRTKFEDAELEPGKTYYYKVKAYQQSEEGGFSNTVELKMDMDSDKDGLPDHEEITLTTDPMKNDTDEDGLSDSYELKVLFSDPLKKDSNDNGTMDGEEDSDFDGLSNLREYELGTNPLKEDTDLDGLTDPEEMAKKTDSLIADTDQDGLLDGEEEPLGFDPLKKDTDGNGTPDGEEIIVHETVVEETEKDPLVSPSIEMTGPAIDANSITITKVEDEDAFIDENIPGYIGAPYDFNSLVSFDEVIMSFQYAEAVVSEGFDPAIYYYNEEAQRLEMLEGQTHDPITNTVTAKVTHFSKYILLNKAKWDEAWATEIRPPDLDQSGKVKNIDVVFSIDSSGSMGGSYGNDPSEIRKVASKKFVDKLKEEDRAAVVDFDSSARVLVSLTTDKQEVKYAIDTINSSGGTNLYNGVMEAVEEIKNNGNPDHLRFVIFLTDGDGYWNDEAIQFAKDNQVIIYTIGLGNGVNQNLLEKIAAETGGKYFFAEQADELEKQLEETAEETIDYTKDTDEDGLPDYLEKKGMRLGNGKLVKTDYEDPDTDGDGLKDGEEVTTQYIPMNGGYFVTISDPLKVDTDKDTFPDASELPARRQIPEILPKTTLIMSDMSYINLKRYVDGKPDVVDIGYDWTIRLKHGLANPNTDVGDWNLVKAVDNNTSSSGFGAHAYKKGNNIVIVYRGSDNIAKWDNKNDWIGNLGGIGLLNYHYQLPEAYKFAAEVIAKYPSAKFYITGHSLGGYLAQTVSYKIYEKDLVDEVELSKKQEEKVSYSLNLDHYQNTRTYNAAFYFPVKLFNAATWVKLFSSPIPFWKLNNEEYREVVFNYSIDKDMLRLAEKAMEGQRMGGMALEFPYPHDKNDPVDAHSLDYFYPYIQEMMIYEYPYSK
ncbi:S-layer homology domain-containing protein [Mesobacillus jeotgali]|uniref:S-layer homology domain-containing protein n=1 Tax=Mesobacillus jeotgali TaxID=129985 RepID=UPI0022271944|nr:S-layer homology domain-containing protein [Mesobacillus jeotgali]UYZ21808.1 S-layer homology domain-containing protein [Mesobacillus jeotgali]